MQSGPSDFSTRGFWSLIFVQFQVALNDNTLRFLVTFMGLGLGLWKRNAEAFVPLVGALFSAPFLLFSMTGGYLADRFSKRTATIGIKLFEILVMLLALIGLTWHHVPLMLGCVFLMGTHSALFGPAKYGLLPELLPESRLSWGNGILEMGTFLAIIAGGSAGGWLFETFRARQLSSGAILVSLSMVGLVASLGITRVPAANPAKRFEWNLAADLAAKIRLIRRDRVLWLAVLGNLYFWFLGMLVQQNIVLYGTRTLDVGELPTSYLMAALAVGIGVGSLAAGYLSGDRIEYRLIPLGALGMTVFSVVLSHSVMSFRAAFANLSLLGFFGGFFIVPISAIMQHRPEKGERGAVLATANWLSFAGIFLAAGVYYVLTSPGQLQPRAIFLFGGLATLAGTACVTFLLAGSTLRPIVGRLTTLDRTLIRNARRHPFRFAMADARIPRLRFGAVLTSTVFLARRLRKHWEGQAMVGILLPPSVAGALVNFAALLMGKIPVNLHYTASSDTIAACARQCDIQTVITSRAFIKRVPLRVPGTTIWIEDLAAAPRFGEKVLSMLLAWTLPARMLEKSLGNTRPASLEDLATVIFSSGSTGDPKGVMLTHHNIAANIGQIEQVYPLGASDRILGILPFFHSFGFTGGLILPMVAGFGVLFHPDPLDAKAISSLAGRYAATLLIATPTFLQVYTRRCLPKDFGSLRYVVTGAEKLPDRVARAFEETFGIRPLEGYGCTECSPVISINCPDRYASGSRQVGNKRGTVGRPLPGVSVRIVHPETMEPLPLGRSGLLLVKGPNMMKGYLGQPEKTAEVLRDGWYSTGDVVSQDADGFLTITDRLSRFSKIGGESVPHIKVEESLQELAGMTEPAFAVVGVPDEKKGERLVVLHTLPDDQLQKLLQKLPELDLPNLWKPRPNHFFHVASLPLLGTGKLDLRKLRDLALQLSVEP